MKILFSVIALVLSLPAFSATDLCSVSYRHVGSKLNWTAFKAPTKIGVTGQFTGFSIKSTKSNNVDGLLLNASFEVDTQSVFTNDKGRDTKIFQFFFKQMAKGTGITGRVVKVSATDVEVNFTLNGVTKKVSLAKKYEESKNTVTLNGTINVLDFGMKANLNALTKACGVLHEGVTWPDVNIELVAMVPKSCK